MANHSSTQSKYLQQKLLDNARQQCLEKIQIQQLTNEQSNWCPIVWDSIVCWPATPSETLQSVKCPSYVYDFNYNGNATRFCTENGNWYFDKQLSAHWSNYSQCLIKQSNVKHYLTEHVPSYYLITVIGYTLSLVTLLAAFFIFTLNKYVRIKYEPFSCKIFTIIWQFSLMANYNWILMEAVYLHNLISFNTFNDNSSIYKYVIFGWSMPALLIIPWTIVKSLYENNECWTTNDNTYIFWIIRGPITLSIVLNLLFFINIIRVLFMKIFSTRVPPNQINRKYSKWFRSTLVLVPLFGVHYAFLLICKTLAFSHLLEITWLYFDLIFTSFQGFFVALLYCFLNGEVLKELRKLWTRFWINQTGRTYTSRKQIRHVSGTCNSITTQSYRQKDINNNQLEHSANNCIYMKADQKYLSEKVAMKELENTMCEKSNEIYAKEQIIKDEIIQKEKYEDNENMQTMLNKPKDIEQANQQYKLFTAH